MAVEIPPDMRIRIKHFSQSESIAGPSSHVEFLNGTIV
jgi:hypothetical protein